MDNLYQIQRLKEVINKMYDTLSLINECKETIRICETKIEGATDRMKKLSIEYCALHNSIYREENNDKNSK